jgi:hypothetical protein
MVLLSRPFKNNNNPRRTPNGGLTYMGKRSHPSIKIQAAVDGNF